jgi:hypothetical protein
MKIPVTLSGVTHSVIAQPLALYLPVLLLIALFLYGIQYFFALPPLPLPEGKNGEMIILGAILLPLAALVVYQTAKASIRFEADHLVILGGLQFLKYRTPYHQIAYVTVNKDGIAVVRKSEENWEPDNLDKLALPHLIVNPNAISSKRPEIQFSLVESTDCEKVIAGFTAHGVTIQKQPI